MFLCVSFFASMDDAIQCLHERSAICLSTRHYPSILLLFSKFPETISFINFFAIPHLYTLTEA